MPSLRVHEFPLAKGLHVVLDLRGARAVLVQVLDEDGTPTAPAAPYELSLDDGPPLTTRRATWRFGELAGAQRLRLRFPEEDDLTVQVLLAAAAGLLEAG